jgi:hypothetical protein
MQQTNFGTFPRPMLNSPIEHPDYSGEVFVAKTMARLNASRLANQILVDCIRVYGPGLVPNNPARSIERDTA